MSQPNTGGYGPSDDVVGQKPAQVKNSGWAQAAASRPGRALNITTPDWLTVRKAKRPVPYIRVLKLAAKPILDSIKKIGNLSSLLPETVSEAPADDDIHRIITRIEHPDGTVAATFNRRFDILFSEDTRVSDGRLKNIRRGNFGVGCVVEYLESIHWELAKIAPLPRNPLLHAR
ncbi:hypothetical protein B0H13DRAFT_2320945 [Mycena leptocephala]|nr:hypothetical protein B0H13DRAFT_2320945 [Mycena leptocephala]